MEQQEPYVIAHGSDLLPFAKLVNELVARGYRPIGNLIRVDGIGYRQPMWKDPMEIEMEQMLKGASGR